MSDSKPDISHMVDSSRSLDEIRKKAENSESSDDNNKSVNLWDDIKNLSSANTSMGFQLFANRDKLINSSARMNYEQINEEEKKQYSEQRSEKKTHTDRKSESIDDYIRDKDNNSSDAPKPSKYGPSYGDGDSDHKRRDDYDDNEFNSKEEEELAKLDMLRKLAELHHNHGVKLSQNYSMAHSYKSMKYEYELHKGIRAKKLGVKWLSNMMISLCWGLEMANDYFNPFDFHLDGWHKQLDNDRDEYYDVLGELYDKYYGGGRTPPPELKFVMMLSASAFRYHILQSKLSNIQSTKNIISNNPQLAEMLRKQAKQNTSLDDKMHQCALNRIPLYSHSQ